MSHVVKIGPEIKELTALQRACERLGWQWRANQTTFKWYGRWVNDYHADNAAYKQGIDTKDYGKCAHAIAVPGCRYEIGLVADKEKPNTYNIVYDFYDTALKSAVDGGGVPGGKLLQAYALELAKLNAQRKGHSVSEQVLPSGAIKLTIQSG